ncbi:putative transposase [Loktanella sp. DSM 29012]|uniref:hypothetical protein n=1 Tax=Loktanella sp. DSM 29012 TaxID=1881056 RepID=UPI0008BA26C5|nr:hypothetical protein [Loktanella sp. DSM 29012]SEQ85634.1 putative transposase [Loktanella sp. DSM 29012]
MGFAHIKSGQPQQSAWIEPNNRTVRYDWLDQYNITGNKDSQHFATPALDFNDDHKNMGIGRITLSMKLKTAAS